MFYSYDENKLYNGEIEGQKNPRGQGRLQPADTTVVAPPEMAEGETAKFSEVSQSWAIVPDERYNDVKLQEVNDDGVLKYELDENGFIKDRAVESIDEDKKGMAIVELYNEMVKDIYAEMLAVFGTDNDVSAQAFASTYEAMAKRPANYVGELGLIDEAAVLAYANAEIAKADAYAIYRMNRILQFQTAKAAL